MDIQLRVTKFKSVVLRFVIFREEKHIHTHLHR